MKWRRTKIILNLASGEKTVSCVALGQIAVHKGVGDFNWWISHLSSGQVLSSNQGSKDSAMRVAEFLNEKQPSLARTVGEINKKNPSDPVNEEIRGAVWVLSRIDNGDYPEFDRELLERPSQKKEPARRSGKWERKDVTLALGGGQRKTLNCQVLGQLAVHKSLRGRFWNISHVASGMVILGDIGTENRAMKIAEFLAKEKPILARFTHVSELGSDAKDLILSLKRGEFPEIHSGSAAVRKEKRRLERSKNSTGSRNPYQGSIRPEINMNKAQAQRTLNQLRKTVEHRERQLAEVKRDERRGKADEREVMFAESELDLAEDDLRIFMEDVAQPLGLTRFASSDATSWDEKTAALISGKSFMLVGDDPLTGDTEVLVEGLGSKGSSFDERRAVREGYTNVRLVPEGSRLAKNLPKSVERYVKEHKEQGNDEAKSWALAWSRYCKYKNPDSPHCQQKDYFTGKTATLISGNSRRPIPFPNIPASLMSEISEGMKKLKSALRGTPDFGRVSRALMDIQTVLEDDFRGMPQFRERARYNGLIADWAKAEYERKTGDNW